MTDPKPNYAGLIALVLGLLLLLSGGLGGGVGPFNPPGPRLALIVHEQNDDTTDWGAFAVALRTGEPAKYIASKGHKALILDKDSKDENGQPAAILTKFAPYTTPELLIISGDKALHRERLPASPKVESVLAILKANGG